MQLLAESPTTLSGRYVSYRFGTTHRVSATVSGALSHEIKLDIHEFNGLPAQPFTGYLATEGRHLIAGWTQWREELFGFFARRSQPRPLTPYRAGEAVPGDYAGRYTLRCDGGPYDVEVTGVDGNRLTGQLRGVGDIVGDIVGEVDPGDPLLVSLTLGDGVVFTGRLFSRPKNVVAGWIDLEAVRAPCYLVRIG